MKKKTVITIIFIIFLVLIIGLILLVPKLFKVQSKEGRLTELTKEFYSYYYDEIGKTNDVKKFLENYKDSGLKISLGDIEVYLDGKHGSKGDYKLFDLCDVDKTSVTIYPKEPYTKTSIEVKPNLSCKEAK